MEATYRREIDAARRDALELSELLTRGDRTIPHADNTLERLPELTVTELMTAIGLATMAHGALLRAAKARASDDVVATT